MNWYVYRESRKESTERQQITLGMIREIIEQGNQIKRIYSQITTERRRQEVYMDKCLLKTEFVRETLKGSRAEEVALLKDIIQSLESIETARTLLQIQIQNRIRDLENLETEEEEAEEEKEIYPAEDPEKVKGRIYQNL